MYAHRSGFRIPNEPMATHARRRLRLVPSPSLDPSQPQPDPSLWLLYYCQTEISNHFPSRSIQVSEQVRQNITDRMQLHRHGQLVRKEFMLHDTASWPTINPPGNPNQAYSQQPMGYPNDVMAHMNRSQQQAFIQQQQANAAQRGVGPSPAKRPRHGAPGSMQVSSTAIPAPMVPPDSIYEDEDGTVGGDYMDFLTPRDISLNRYIQHHEWLEEILESPYDTNQIIPGELGLGRKGELESLTRDFFEAPTGPTPKEKFDPKEDSRPIDEVPSPRVGRLEAGKAEDFTKRALERVAEINAEMEKLKRQHAKRIAKLNKGRILKEAEKKLRLETIEMINADPNTSRPKQTQSTDDIALAAFGKPVQTVLDVECLQKGGLEEKSESKDGSDHDFDMVDNFDGPSDERSAVPERQEPGTTNDVGSIPQKGPQAEAEASKPDEVPEKVGQAQASEEAPKDPAAEDWIMVNKEGNSPAGEQDVGDMENFANDVAMQPSMDDEAVDGNPGNDNLPAFDPNADPNNNPNFPSGEAATEEFETTDFGEGIDFGDLNTAGDELSGYTQALEDPGVEEHGDMGGTDSAFGDAFQDTEAHSAQ